MAKYAKRKVGKRHKARTHHRRRRGRVGAMSLNLNSTPMKLMLIGGAYLFAGEAINTAIDNAVPADMQTNANYDKLAGAGEGVLGYLLAFKGKKSAGMMGTLKTVAGCAAIGAALARFVKPPNILGGYYNIPVLAGGQKQLMNGFHDVPVIGGKNEMRGYKVPQNVGAYFVPKTNKVMNGIGCMDDQGGSGINQTGR